MIVEAVDAWNEPTGDGVIALYSEAGELVAWHEGVNNGETRVVEHLAPGAYVVAVAGAGASFGEAFAVTPGAVEFWFSVYVEVD